MYTFSGKKLCFVKKCISLAMKLKICRKSCDSQVVGNKTKSFITKKYFINVKKNYSMQGALVTKTFLYDFFLSAVTEF